MGLILICWTLAALIGLGGGLLLRAEKRAQGAEIEAVETTAGAEYYDELCRSWRGLRLANEHDYSRRPALMNLSTAIWRMGQGEGVEPKVLDYLLGQLKGGAEVLAKIKGVGA